MKTLQKTPEEKTLPTFSELIGIDKFQLTESQKNDCKMIANHRGTEAAIDQAKKFNHENTTRISK